MRLLILFMLSSLQLFSQASGTVRRHPMHPTADYSGSVSRNYITTTEYHTAPAVLPFFTQDTIVPHYLRNTQVRAQTAKQLPTYVCEPGANDFKPKTVAPSIYWLFGGKSAPRAAFEFTPSCWYDWMLPDGTQDQDIHDWSYKLFGLSPLLEPNDKNGLMVAGRCAKDSFKLELCVYQNIDKAFFIRSSPIVFDVRVVYRLYVQWLRKEKDKIHPIIWATDRKGNQLFVQECPPVEFKWQPCKAIWLWHGGENNSNGQYGGPASQAITIMADKF